MRAGKLSMGQDRCGWNIEYDTLSLILDIIETIGIKKVFTKLDL